MGTPSAAASCAPEALGPGLALHWDRRLQSGLGPPAIPTKLVNCYDIAAGLREVLQSRPNLRSFSDLHLGPDQGNVTRVPLDQLTTPVDGLCSGPPCPPWAGNGSNKAEDDPRVAVFLTVIKWVKHLIANGGLLFAVLENVVGIHQKIRGEESFLDKTLRDLRQTCVEFEWVSRNLAAKDYGLAQERNRVFIVGSGTAY